MQNVKIETVIIESSGILVAKGVLSGIVGNRFIVTAFGAAPGALAEGRFACLPPRRDAISI